MTNLLLTFVVCLMKMMMEMKYERCLHASAEAGLVPWRPATCYLCRSVCLAPHHRQHHHLTTHWDWRTANTPCGIELKFYVSFDMDKHLNLISTFETLIILNKR